MAGVKRAVSTFADPASGLIVSGFRFVPAHISATDDDVRKLQEFVLSKKRLVVMTGAGISTESGIPDYRGEGVGLYSTSKQKPMQYQHFIGSETFRRRYWARNYVGWPRFSSMLPNATHKFLADLEHRLAPSTFQWLITQNVDGLHIKAGSRKVTELHGSAFKVTCLNCEHMVTRSWYQSELQKANPDFAKVSPLELRPDADVELDREQESTFNVVPCGKCGGIMKPFIVYFGENVPEKRKELTMQKVDECDGLLVLGSSLQVYSGYRYALRAAELKKSLCIVNIGPTRADHLANLRIDKIRCADLFSRIYAALS